MLTKIEKKTSKRRKPLKRAVSKKVDWDKYWGKAQFDTDGLTYQKQIRSNE